MNFGLKLWSINIDYYYDEAQKLYEEGVFNYIELYIVPHSLFTLEKWKKLNIQFTLHAPHFMHDINLADKRKFEYNKEIFFQVDEFSKTLNAKHTVIHCGMNNDIKETVRQLNIIKPRLPLVENKPYKAPLKPELLCRGAVVEEIQYVLEQSKCGFCLDIGHAICTANSLEIDPYQYLEKFEKLNPICYHLSGNYIESDMDSHMHLHEGNYDYKKIFSIIDTKKPIAIETKKDSKTLLCDFALDSQFLKKIMGV